METTSSALPSIDRAWQSMRFVTKDMFGPLARPYVADLAALQVELEKSLSRDPRAGVVAFYDAIADTRSQKILAAAIMAKTSLG